MAIVRYRSSSPYFRTPQTNWYLDQFVPREIGPDPADEMITVEAKHEFRPDLLSFDLYGSVDYWWVFMVRNMNDIRDPIFDLRAGLQIMVPTRQRVTGMMT